MKNELVKKIENGFVAGALLMLIGFGGGGCSSARYIETEIDAISGASPSVSSAEELDAIAEEYGLSSSEKYGVDGSDNSYNSEN